jgi:hypothetical protein
MEYRYQRQIQRHHRYEEQIYSGSDDRAEPLCLKERPMCHWCQ